MTRDSVGLASMLVVLSSERIDALQVIRLVIAGRTVFDDDQKPL